MSELVQKLRAHAKWCRDKLGSTHDGELCQHAADRIVGLEGEVERLKAAIKLHVASQHVLEDRAEAAEAKLENAQREIRYLRLYGNKDCTAMADEAMAAGELDEAPKWLTTHPPAHS